MPATHLPAHRYTDRQTSNQAVSVFDFIQLILLVTECDFFEPVCTCVRNVIHTTAYNLSYIVWAMYMELAMKCGNLFQTYNWLVVQPRINILLILIISHVMWCFLQTYSVDGRRVSRGTCWFLGYVVAVTCSPVDRSRLSEDCHV